MEKLKSIFWATRTRRIATTVVACGLVAVLIGAILVQTVASDWSKNRITAFLEQRFQSEVEMDNFQATVFPSPAASADGVRFFHRGRRDLPPVITLEGFSVTTSLGNLFSRPVRLGDIHLRGLLIQIPPKEEAAKPEDARPAEDSAMGDTVPLPREDANDPPTSSSEPLIAVGQIIADGAEIRLLPMESFKQPQVYSMERLRLSLLSTDAPMAFDTALTTPDLPGQIVSQGSFGPWNGDHPGESPVSGEYSLNSADLSVFNGIQGALSSSGAYEGVLAYLNVRGEANVPDFAVNTGGAPVSMHARFAAIVDGTSGDIPLEAAEASFRKTTLTAQGGIYQKQGAPGKTLELDVDIPQAPLEDLLHFGVKGKTPLQGQAKVKTHVTIPPGEQQLPLRTKLKGNFAVHSATFPDWNIQKQVEELSDRASGKPEKTPNGDVVSNLHGNFAMANGVLKLQGLKFRVPSAQLALNGDYGVLDESLNFRGTLTMDAKVSEATTGFKSFLAKIVNPIFSRKHAGAVIPIRISGNRKDPKFGLALGGTK